MAAPKCRVEIWNPIIAGTATNKWIKAQNPENRNAVMTLVVKETLGNPKRCKLVISNRAKDFTSASGTFVYTYYDSWDNAAGNATIAQRRGVLTDLFTDFMPIRLIDEATNQIYFLGRVRKAKTGHQKDKGETITIEASDALDELIQIDGKGAGAKELQFYKAGTVMEYDDDTVGATPGNTQTDIVKSLISLAYKKDSLNLSQSKVSGFSEVKMWQLTQDTVYYPPLALSTAIRYAANIVTDDSGTNLYNRFQNETQIISADRVIDISKMDKGILGEILKVVTATPQASQKENESYGWDYFADPNISYGAHSDFRGKNFDPTAPAPPAMFNVFERGTRIYNIEPATYGLAVKFPASSIVPSQGHRTTYSGGSPTAQYATKPMSAEFDFNHPKDGLYTSVALTYEDAEKHDEDENITSKKGKDQEILMEIMYVRSISGKFNYETSTGTGDATEVYGLEFRDRDRTIMQDEDGDPTETRPGLHSAEWLDLYNENGIGKLRDKVARIQYQSKSTSNSSTYGYIILSDVNSCFRELPAGTYRLYGAGDSEGNNASGKYCLVDLDATIPQEGYPRRVWNLEKQKKLKKGIITELTALRHEVASILSRSSLDIVDGEFQISGPPMYFIDLDVKSVATVTGGQRLELQHLGQTTGAGTAVDVSRYGFREGMQIAKMNASNRAENYTASFNITDKENNTVSVMQDVYGYCFDIPTATQYSVNTHTSSTLAAGDPVRLYIPIRVGDCIRVENVMSNVAGNHLVTDVEFTEEPIQMTKIKSTGVNEGFGLEGTIYQAILAGSRDESDLTRMLPKGHQAAIWTGLFSAVDFNTIQWQPVDTKAEVVLMDGTVYNVDTSTTNNIRNTDSSATDQNGTRFGLATPPAAGDNVVYYVYLDPDDENIADGEKYHFYTRPAKTPATGTDPVYEQDGDNIIIAWMKAASTETGLAEFGVYRDAKPDNSGRNLDTFIHRGSATSALLKKGAQTFTTDLALYATTYDHDDAHKKIKWHGGEEGATTTNATIKLADGDTRTITRGGDLSNDGGGQYRVTTSGNLTGTMVNAFDVSSTYYVYIDFAQETSGDMNLRFTKDYSVPYGDDRVLLAMLVVAANASKGRSPMILPLTTKSLAINAVAIAANSITADHITAASIDVDHLQLTGTNAIGGIASNGALNFSFGTNTGSLDNIADGSSKVSVSPTEKTNIADGVAAKVKTDAGLDDDGNIIRNIVAKGAGTSPTFYSWAGTTTQPGSLVLVNAAGIAGYSGVTGTYVEGSSESDGLTLPPTPQFEIRTADGRGYFGGGNIMLWSSGMYIKKDAGTGTIEWEHHSGGGSTFIHKVASANNVRFSVSDSATSANAVLFASWIGNTNEKVPQGHFTNLYTYEMTATGVILNSRSGTGTPSFHATAAPAQFEKGLWFKDETSVPNPSSSSYIRLYSESNVLKYRNSSGTVTTVGGASEGDDYQWTGLHKFDNSGGILLKNHSSAGAAAPSGYSKLISLVVSGVRKLIWLDDDGETDIISDIGHTGGGGGGGGGGPTVLAGLGMDFSGGGTGTITVTMGTPLSSSPTTNNALFSTGHTHEITGTSSGGSYNHPTTHTMSDGSESAPAYSFSNAAQTGMYRGSATLRFSISNQDVFTLNGGNTPSFALLNSSGTNKVYGYGSSGNMYVTGGLFVTGAISKGSGSFLIDHPLDDDKYLLHGFVEAPRYDLIYRGTATLSSGTVTANIDTDSDMSDGTYVALTKNSQVWVQNKTGWAAVKGSVQGNKVIITCQDDTSTDEVDWLVVAERNDKFIKSDSDINTDSEGKFIPEQLKVERHAKYEPLPEDG